MHISRIVRTENGVEVYIYNGTKNTIEGGTLHIICGQEDYTLEGKLPAGQESTIIIAASQGDTVSLEGAEASDSVVLQELPAGLLLKRTSKGWRYFTGLERDPSNGWDNAQQALCDNSSPIVISEVCPSGNGTQGWVELHNTSDSTIALDGYTVYTDLAGKAFASLNGRSIAAGEYLTLSFRADGFSHYDLTVKCNRQMLCLVRSRRAVSTVFWNGSVPANMSVGYQDGRTVYYAPATPGAENSAPLFSGSFRQGEGRITVSELLIHNTLSLASPSGKRTAWAELYNPGNSDVSLGGIYLSNNAENPLMFALPDTVLPAKGRIIVFFAGKKAKAGSTEVTFKLTELSGGLYITDTDTMTTQCISINAQAGENISQDASGKLLEMPSPGYDGGVSKRNIIINEVCSVQEAKSKTGDWVELYNPTDTDISLDGLYLSDSKNNLTRCALSGTIAAKGYKVIRNSSLRIAAAGENVYLSDDEYITDVFAAPKLLPQYTAGRTDSAAIYLMPPTPGSRNSSKTLLGYAASPVFSENGGYYKDGLTLGITSADGSEIHYTLDGSTPDSSSPVLNGTIEIKSTTVVRAVAVKSGYADSAETVATFRTGKDEHLLPVICLSMTKSDLNYVTSSASRLDVRERAGYVECYAADGARQTGFPAGFTIGGNGTRKYPQKTFNLHLRGAYGQSSVSYPFFEYNTGFCTYSSLALRNSGQDAYSTRLRDAFVSMATNGMKVYNAQSKMVVVYLNGKYHGLYEFKENQNEDYLAAHTGCDRNTVQIVRANTNVYNGIGDNSDIKALIDFAATADMSDDKNYQKYIQWVDEDYYTDYLICISFFILSDAYNQKSIRSMDGVVKWSPILYDLDGGLNSYRSAILKRFFTKAGIFTPSGFRVETVLFNAFYQNAGWREKFTLRYCELLNTTLRTENLLALFDSMTELVRPEMARNCERWKYPESLSKWEENVKTLRHNISARRKYAIEELKNTFRVSDARLRELLPDDDIN